MKEPFESKVNGIVGRNFKGMLEISFQGMAKGTSETFKDLGGFEVTVEGGFKGTCETKFKGIAKGKLKDFSKGSLRNVWK